jgi:hypothetical protein
MNDERRLNRLPIPRETGRVGRRILRALAPGERVQFGIVRGQQTRFGINAPHLDPVPETAKREPRLTFFVEDQVGINGIEVIFCSRPKDKAAIDPMKIGSGRIQSFIG